MAEQLVEDPALRQRYIFRMAQDENGDDVAQVEFWVDPGGGVVPHRHPTMEERFVVLDGEVTFTVDRRKHVTRAGGTAVAPPGSRHTYKNTGTEVAHVVCNARPPLPELQQFLEDAAAIGRAGGYTRHALPKTPSALLQLAIMARSYRASTVVLTIPRFLQPLLEPLARLGERRGYRAGRFAEGRVGDGRAVPRAA